MIKTAIIGAGAVAYCHADALRKLGVVIAGVYDVRRESAEKLAKAYESKVIDKLDEVIEDIDMIHLCTPPSARIDYVRQAMQAGCHVMIEKPMAVSVEDAEVLVAMAKEYGVKLMVGFNHRFRAGFKMLRESVQSGELGEVVNVYSQRMGLFGGLARLVNSWRMDPKLACGMTIESLSHDIDMLLQLVDGFVTVKADVRGTLAEVPQFDNNANVLFTSKNGSTAVIHSSWASHLRYSARGAIGTKGAAVLTGTDVFDFMDFRLKTAEMPYEKVIKVNDPYRFVGCSSYYEENKHFVECVEKGMDCVVPGELGLKTLKISHAILESSKKNSTVAIDF